MAPEALRRRRCLQIGLVTVGAMDDRDGWVHSLDGADELVHALAFRG